MADTYHVHAGWSIKGLLRNYLEEPQKRVVRYPKCPVKNNLKDRVGGWVIRPQKEALHGVLKALKALAFKGEFSVTHNDWGGGSQKNTCLLSTVLGCPALSSQLPNSTRTRGQGSLTVPCKSLSPLLPPVQAVSGIGWVNGRHPKPGVHAHSCSALSHRTKMMEMFPI